MWFARDQMVISRFLQAICFLHMRGTRSGKFEMGQVKKEGLGDSRRAQFTENGFPRSPSPPKQSLLQTSILTAACVLSFLPRDGPYQGSVLLFLITAWDVPAPFRHEKPGLGSHCS